MPDVLGALLDSPHRGFNLNGGFSKISTAFHAACDAPEHTTALMCSYVTTNDKAPHGGAYVSVLRALRLHGTLNCGQADIELLGGFTE